jgi:hypothetical protein
MANPRVFTVGAVQGLDGSPIRVSVDYGAVRVHGDAMLGPAQQETFAALFVHASWLAGKHDDEDGGA